MDRKDISAKLEQIQTEICAVIKVLSDIVDDAARIREQIANEEDDLK